MLVRLAIETDEPAFIELGRLAQEESQPLNAFDPEVTRGTFHAYLKSARPTIFVVERNRELIGFMLATMNAYWAASGLFTAQEVLYVRPDMRGTRAAVELLDHFIAWSQRLGAIEITGGNDNAIFTERTARLLERRGFERVGIFMRRKELNDGEKGSR